jgi:hypothetical protein
MTKAKEVLKVLTKKGTAFLSENDMETIRKALELLDKVERGGVDLMNKCIAYDPDDEARSIVKNITNKYILIEREQ